MTPYEQQAEKIAVSLEQEGLLAIRPTTPWVKEVIARILTESASGEGDRCTRCDLTRDWHDVDTTHTFTPIATTEQANRPEPDNG